MAQLKIYNDIVDEKERIMLRDWEGIDAICYKDIDDFLSKMDPKDKVIDIRLHCRGGDCVEGWAIYDALRRSKKEIWVTVEGECSSMATVILLAAPLERRTAYKNAHFCIHNPAVMWIETDYPARLTADSIEKVTEQMTEQAKLLRQEEDKMLNLYVQRTNATRGELVALMKKDTFITTDKAIELGFISKTLAPNTATRTNKTISQTTKPTVMAKPKVHVEQSKLNRLLAMCGLKKIEDLAQLKAQEITSADGSVFTVEREDGDPQVGDTAYPDGTYVMEDGTTIVVENQVITEISEPVTDPNDPNALDENELTEKVEELEEKVDELEKDLEEKDGEIKQLQEDKKELEEKIEAMKEARVLSADETHILAKVEKAGGRAWLDKVLGMRSTFTPENRKFKELSHSPESKETPTQKALRERREKADAKRANRK